MREIEGPRRPTQCPKTMPQHGQPGSGPQYPSLPIFPPLPPQAAHLGIESSIKK